MNVLDYGKGYIDFEHEGERFRMGGEVSTVGFVARLDWIRSLSSECVLVLLSEQEQLRVLEIVKKHWDNERGTILLLDGDYRLLYDSEDPEKRKREKTKERVKTLLLRWTIALLAFGMLFFLLFLIVVVAAQKEGVNDLLWIWITCFVAAVALFCGYLAI